MSERTDLATLSDAERLQYRAAVLRLAKVFSPASDYLLWRGLLGTALTLKAANTADRITIPQASARRSKWDGIAADLSSIFRIVADPAGTVP